MDTFGLFLEDKAAERETDQLYRFEVIYTCVCVSVSVCECV
jgi:hypothetical protein